MSAYWIVVADNAKARIFAVDRVDGNLQLVDTLVHPEGHRQAKDINADRPGRAFDIVGHGRHSMGTEVDPVGRKSCALQSASMTTCVPRVLPDNASGCCWSPDRSCWGTSGNISIFRQAHRLASWKRILASMRLRNSGNTCPNGCNGGQPT